MAPIDNTLACACRMQVVTIIADLSITGMTGCGQMDTRTHGHTDKLKEVQLSKDSYSSALIWRLCSWLPFVAMAITLFDIKHSPIV